MIPVGERPIMVVVGENIEKFRKEAGIPIYKFCEMAGLDSARYGKLVSGLIQSRPSKLQEFAAVLGINSISLFEDWR